MKRRPLVPEPARRHPVWAVLAELYLDTELQEDDLRHIAATVAASGFDWAEIQQINYDEVAPALWFNTYDIAGEWAGWDDKWLIERITVCYTGRHQRTLGFKSIWRWRVDYFTGKYLAKVAAYLP